MLSDGHASPSLAEFAPHERQGRVGSNSGHQQCLGQPMPALLPIRP